MASTPRNRLSSFVALLTGIQSRVERLFAFCAAMFIMVLMFLTTSEVIGRYLFNTPVPGSYEISEFLLIGVVFLGIAYVQSLKGHVSVDILLGRFPNKIRIALDFLGLAIGLFTFAIMTWQSGFLAWRAWRLKEYAMGIYHIPYWPAKFVFVLGVALLCTRLIIDVLHDISLVKGGKHES